MSLEHPNPHQQSGKYEPRTRDTTTFTRSSRFPQTRRENFGNQQRFSAAPSNNFSSNSSTGGNPNRQQQQQQSSPPQHED